MAQRNPMNDRYNTEEKKGQTRKSAATAKPKTKAASSVHIQSSKKNPKEKKELQQLDKKRQQEIGRKYYNPPTADYKKWRKVWWALLILAVVMTALSFLFRFILPDIDLASTITLVGAYVGIIGALIIDGAKIRKIRKEYQQMMIAKETKAMRAAEKKQRSNKSAETENAAENKTGMANFLDKAKFVIFGKMASSEPKSTPKKSESVEQKDISDTNQTEATKQ